MACLDILGRSIYVNFILTWTPNLLDLIPAELSLDREQGPHLPNQKTQSTGNVWQEYTLARPASPSHMSLF